MRFRFWTTRSPVWRIHRILCRIRKGSTVKKFQLLKLPNQTTKIVVTIVERQLLQQIRTKAATMTTLQWRILRTSQMFQQLNLPKIVRMFRNLAFNLKPKLQL
uniref:(northern house mosquito) hypothetical protein n=1 Tax=Culex pipiens TaxID=7175 RepID=A0A8D8AT65_CULPI